MKYDFTSVIDRRGMDSIAVEPPDDSPYRRGLQLRASASTGGAIRFHRD